MKNPQQNPSGFNNNKTIFGHLTHALHCSAFRTNSQYLKDYFLFILKQIVDIE